VLFTTVYVHDAHSSLIFSDITLKRVYVYEAMWSVLCKVV